MRQKIKNKEAKRSFASLGKQKCITMTTSEGTIDQKMKKK